MSSLVVHHRNTPPVVACAGNMSRPLECVAMIKVAKRAAPRNQQARQKHTQQRGHTHPRSIAAVTPAQVHAWGVVPGAVRGIVRAGAEVGTPHEAMSPRPEPEAQVCRRGLWSPAGTLMPLTAPQRPPRNI